MAVLLSSCAKTEQAAQGGEQNAWTKPHVLTFGDFGEIATLNPHLSTFADTQYIGQLTSAYLIRWNRSNSPVPDLITVIPSKANGGVSVDGLTITYHLRHGVKWSDGAPFTADDVTFSTSVVLNPKNNETNRSGWTQITKVDEPDKYTVVYHLSKPYSPFVETFFSSAEANPSVLPKHLLAQYPTINTIPYNEKPVGIGPFVVDHWDRGSQVVLKANPLYWRGRPKLDEIIFKELPDRNTLLAQLQTHEIDMWPLIPGAYLSQVKSIPGVVVFREPSYYWNNVSFNLAHPVMQDHAVRQALYYAFDRRTIFAKIAHGIGVLSDVPTPPNVSYAVTGVPVTPFDLSKANQILNSAGWVRGPDGVRSKNGTRLAFTWVTTAGNADVDNMIAIIQADYAKIGATMSVKHVPGAVLFAPDGQLASGKWDIANFAWLADAVGDYSQLFACNAFSPSGQNYPHWCNKQADAAMDSLYAHYDQTDRDRDVAVFMKQFLADLPVMVYDIREDMYGYNSDLKNFRPNNISQFDNMMDVDI